MPRNDGEVVLERGRRNHRVQDGHGQTPRRLRSDTSRAQRLARPFHQHAAQ